jgi:hypothetical protein
VFQVQQKHKAAFLDPVPGRHVVNKSEVCMCVVVVVVVVIIIIIVVVVVCC